jgi:pyrroloquinoline quinone (PQQ) biosynthesis protein C
MQTALDRLNQSDDLTAVSSRQKYSEYLQHHIGEERAHDEWLLSDLSLLGQNRAEVLAVEPLPEVAHLVGSQYYWILHHNPLTLLGYIAVLEGAPPSSAKLDRMQLETGFPTDAFRTLRMHADVDGLHSEELDKLLDELELSKNDQHSILMNAARTVFCLADSLKSLSRFSRSD